MFKNRFVISTRDNVRTNYIVLTSYFMLQVQSVGTAMYIFTTCGTGATLVATVASVMYAS